MEREFTRGAEKNLFDMIGDAYATTSYMLLIYML
jgi:hypothetical protein